MKSSVSLKSKFKKLVWIEIAIYLVMVLVGILLGQRVYQAQSDTEGKNVLRVCFANMENTFHSIDSIALNLVNDRTIQLALREVQQSEDSVVLLDDLYYELISKSMLGTGNMIISILDTNNNEYSSGSTTLHLTPQEIENVYSLLNQRSSLFSPVWMKRSESDRLLYARYIYGFPYKQASAPLGVVVIQTDMHGLLEANLKDSPKIGMLSVRYADQVVCQVEQPSGESQEANGLRGWFAEKLSRTISLSHQSEFPGLEFYAEQSYQLMAAPIQTIFKSMILSLILLCGISLVLSLHLMHQITRPLQDLASYTESIDIDVISKNKELPPMHSSIKELDMLNDKIVQMIYKLQELVESNYLRDVKEKEYQLRALQSQINPHFLYNTLDSINWLAIGCDQTEISTMVQSLATLFREATRQQNYMVTLEEELKLLSCYTTIQKIRLDDRFVLTLNIAPQCLSCGIPKMSLQPIVENSIQYGAESIEEPCHVLIKAICRRGRTLIYVLDNGPGMSHEQLEKLRRHEYITSSTGIGLINIQERIRMLCAPGSDLTIRSKSGYGTLVKITIYQGEES